MVSKLSENGVASFILANGALSGGGTEYEIRKKLIENRLVEAILVLPRNLFYTTDISVTLWILNKNKKAHTVEVNGETKQYRNRENEILFMDLRQTGEPFEKKYTQFSVDDIQKIAGTYHAWQTVGTVGVVVETGHAPSKNNNDDVINETGHAPSLRATTQYENVPEYCYAATIDEVRARDYSLVPSKYIEFVNRDENVDFDEKMRGLQTEMADLLRAEAQSKQDLLTVFKELGYEIEL